MTRCWRIGDDRQTLVLGSSDDRLPEVIYWGAALPLDEDLDVLLEAHRMDVTGGMVDINPEISLSPETSRTFPGQPGMMIRSADGKLLQPSFRFAAVQDTESGIALDYRDEALGLTYLARIAEVGGVIQLSAALQAEQLIYVDWLAAPVLPAPQLSDEMITLSGRWCGEFQTNRFGVGSGYSHAREPHRADRARAFPRTSGSMPRRDKLFW